MTLAIPILAGMLAACVPVAAPDPSPSPLPSAVPSPLTPTQSPAPSTSPTPDLPATLVASIPPETIQTLTSPDGKFRAEVTRWECTPVGPDESSYEELSLVQAPDGAARGVDTQLSSCGGLGAAGLAAAFWSPDSRILYYTPARKGAPDGCAWAWYPPLVAFEWQSGEKTSLRQGPLSSDRSYLAYWEGSDLVVWSLLGGETARLPAAFPDLHPGPIAWALNEQTLVYLQNGTQPCAFGRSALVLVDLLTYQPVVLLESETPSLIEVGWTADNLIQLRDTDQGEWIFDLNTQTLVPGSSVPTPLPTAIRDREMAEETLVGFFDLLHAKEYEQAAVLFAGSYESLMGHNPSLSPDDYPALLKNGCEINGRQCLRVRSVVFQRMHGSVELRFVVEFENEDGTLFVRGPCCGETEAEMPSQSRFPYAVQRIDGEFQVMNLPVYVP